MRYRVVFTEKAQGQFAQLPRAIRARLGERVSDLAEEPRPSGSVKIKGFDDCYRIRQGDYRVVYAVVDDMLVVLVVRAGHRRDVYERMEALGKRVDKFRETRT